jgi:hypothetical protein
MPLVQTNAIMAADNVVNVKIVCGKTGLVSKPAGDPSYDGFMVMELFMGLAPYAGPGYYGKLGTSLGLVGLLWLLGTIGHDREGLSDKMFACCIKPAAGIRRAGPGTRPHQA